MFEAESWFSAQSIELLNIPTQQNILQALNMQSSAAIKSLDQRVSTNIDTFDGFMYSRKKILSFPIDFYMKTINFHFWQNAQERYW